MTDASAAPVSQQMAVVIPTTAGPVSIVSLIEEPSGIPSLVCINKTTDTAAIASAYDAFVKRPTGVIHRLFGKKPFPAYRLDISDRIEAGASWQLAALIAHALRESKRLDQDFGPTSSLVWATGTVSPINYSVGSVAHVAEKLRSSRVLLETALRAGRPIHILIPADNQSEIDPDIADWLTRHRLTVTPVASADAVFKIFGLPPIPRAASMAEPSTVVWQGNPYRNLEPFLREHRSIFFGRARAREEALEQLRTAAGHGLPFLLVHGQSGVGKSSLVQAGLAGDIEERAREGGRFRTAVITPSSGGDDPVASLWLGIRQISNPSTTEEARKPTAELCEEITGLLRQLVTERHKSSIGQSGLLIVDQLEELFELSIDEEARTAFGELLAQIVRSGVVWVTATIRSDAVGLLDRVPALARLAAPERVYRLDRPSRFELSEIIAAPAAAAGLSFPDRSVPEELADIAARSPDSLPLLQCVLYQFFNQADARGHLTAQGLKRIGGFEGTVGRWADSVCQAIIQNGIAPNAIDRALISLIRIDPETKAGLARLTPYDPLTDTGRILEHLVENRLVSLHETSNGTRARLAHEALITHWKHLADLVTRLSSAIALRDELEDRARKWSLEQGELLTRAARIESAQLLINDALVAIDPIVKKYADASAEAAEAERLEAQRLLAAEAEAERLKRIAVETRIRQQRRMVWLGGLGAAVMSVLMLVAISLWQKSEAETARANQLREEAERQREEIAYQQSLTTSIQAKEAVARRDIDTAIRLSLEPFMTR